jgi:hypothetical protein
MVAIGLRAPQSERPWHLHYTPGSGRARKLGFDEHHRLKSRWHSTGSTELRERRELWLGASHKQARSLPQLGMFADVLSRHLVGRTADVFADCRWQRRTRSDENPPE